MTGAILALLLLFCHPLCGADVHRGYYRFPTLHGDTLVFTAEGDLWRVGIRGGVAERLTTHPGQETQARLSPDGTQVAFSAQYEGPTEVYVMPVAGGLPRRLTYDGGRDEVVGWTPDGKILYATRHFSGLPDVQLVEVDPTSRERTRIPLAQAAEGVFDAPGGTLFFTRFPFQGSHTRRYKGGTAQSIWKFDGSSEAVPLTADYPGTSKAPMFWKGRLYFASDRDGIMNIWSMNPTGRDLKQLTHHTRFNLQSPSLQEGRIVYQLGADLRILDLTTGRDRAIDVQLSSDFDHMREKWVKKPMDYLTAAHLSPSGDAVALTARGEVFVAPAGKGRLAAVTRKKGVRYREARFLPGGTSLVALSDESGEVEVWELPANGVGAPLQLTHDGKILRWEALPSPDGKFIAHDDKNQKLWLYDTAAKTSRVIASSDYGDFQDLSWSPDSRWLAYSVPVETMFQQVFLYSVETGSITALTSDRYDSYSPAWSPDGSWIYLLSDRHFASAVRSPWGSRQPEPFFDRQGQLFQVALKPGLRSPFAPPDELHPRKEKGQQRAAAEKRAGREEKRAEREPLQIDLQGIQTRLQEVPVPPGNYRNLSVNKTHLFWTSRKTGSRRGQSLMSLEISNQEPKPETFMKEVRRYELSADGKKMLLQKGDALYVLAATGKPPKELKEFQVNLKDWTFSLDPAEEWQQMFTEAWRLERDYFYDPGMHGLNWQQIRRKYQPLAERVTDRSELSDVLAQMVAELSALHIFVHGGDLRRGEDEIFPASLGALLQRDEAAQGFKVVHVYQSDPDLPAEVSPLARPGVNVQEGDVIESVNGVPTLSVAQIGELLRHQAGKQVLLGVRSVAGQRRQVVVTPISQRRAGDLRYHEWELTRRRMVDRLSDKRLGYVHLRAMGSNDIAQWERDFYPVFPRQGLIIDVRHNRGGNIDSWILEKLMRKAWMYWKPRVGKPYWNMQEAFRGPMVVLTDAFTASDGEAFSEGFRRLGLGKIIGTRTWGGEIWLTSSNVLVDHGIATAAEFGVYGPEGQWLIEGHGVDPDITVDNLPRATFKGGDAQLKAAVDYLLKALQKNPVAVPPAPPYPDKSKPQ